MSAVNLKDHFLAVYRNRAAPVVGEIAGRFEMHQVKAKMVNAFVNQVHDELVRDIYSSNSNAYEIQQQLGSGDEHHL